MTTSLAAITTKEIPAFVTLLNDLCKNIAEGGSITGFAVLREMDAVWLREWVEEKPYRIEAIEKAMKHKELWIKDLVQAENLRLGLGPVSPSVQARDKLKALELAGRDAGLFKERKDVVVSVEMGEIVERARARVADRRARTVEPPSAPVPVRAERVYDEL